MTNPISQAARNAAEAVVSAANIVTHDGYYEVDIDKVVERLATFEAKIREDERKAVVEWLRTLGNATLTPPILAFFGDPWGDDGQRLCLELAYAISRANHLPKELGNEG